MRDELLEYYERELAFLRHMGGEFARKYPKVAGRLALEDDKCEDPHVERIIEAFAFLAARVHLKVNDEFPEITESLLNVLYPHYLAPIPSMSIAQFLLDPQQGRLTTGYKIDRGTLLYSPTIHGTPCRFQTSYPVVLWPIEVVSATLESLAPADAKGRWPDSVIKISLRCINDTQLSDMKLGAEDQLHPIDTIRFFINGDSQLVYPLYEMILNNTKEVRLQAPALKGPSGRLSKTFSPITLPPTCLKPVGFEPDENLLPYSARSFQGYRLLTEYFAFPDKFLFIDVTGLDQAARAGFGDKFEIQIYLKDVVPPPSIVSAETFQLGCTPIVNLFQKVAEPIQLSQQQHQYHVIPDVHRQMATEIYSVDSVTTTDPYLQQSREFRPFYTFRHAYDRDNDRTFWYVTRRQSQKKGDQGTEVYLSLVDMGLNPHVPAVETVTTHVTCTNRDLPGKLPFGGRESNFEIESGAPISRLRCLKKLTDTLRPSLRRAAHWRLISHLSLNHLSIVNHGQQDSAHALREILMLYDFMDSAATRKQILGVTQLSSRRAVKQIGSRIGAGFVRGIETTIEFDEDQYAGSGVFLLASVLERFLALYASINSFSQLAARTKKHQQGDYLKKWPPRAGEQILL